MQGGKDPIGKTPFEMLEAWMSPSSLQKAGKLCFRCYVLVAPKPCPNFAEICQQDKKSQSSCIDS